MQYLEKTVLLSRCLQKSHMRWPGIKTGFGDKMPSMNGLSHGMAIDFQLSRQCAVTYMSTVIFLVYLDNRNTNFAVNLEIYTFNPAMMKVY